jgi:acetylornithine deacetylase/succinyl-diaminopimelate desuccinylase family protein
VAPQSGFAYNSSMFPSTTQLLSDLVRRPSVNPMGRTDLSADILFEHRVTDYLESVLRGLGVRYERTEVQPGRDNLVAYYRPPNHSARTILWEAHQDTVPVDGMIIDPFAAKIEGDKLYGRGACDVKAGGVAMLTAFARLVESKPANSANVVLAFTVDEEHTFLGIQQLMNRGLRADVAVIAEPTELNIVSAHKGVVRWQIETTGVACHSSRPENGINAIYRMMRVVHLLEQYALQLPLKRDSLLGAATLSVGMIQGGVSPNTVPDRCAIEVDRRLLPGESPESALAEIQAILLSESCSIQTRLGCPALNPANSTVLVQQLGAVIDQVVGKHEVHAVPYGTDASSVSQAGIPAVVFGPGSIDQAHTKDEWIDLKQIPLAAEILYRFACSYGG